VAAVPTIDISRLMRPRSIAIIGISPEPSSAGFLALRNLEEFDYRGAIHLVSRNQSNIGDRACLRAIDDLPDGVDAAMLFLPRVAIEDAVAACARRGLGGAVVFASPPPHARPDWRCADRTASASSISRTAFRSPSRVRSDGATAFRPAPSSSRRAEDLRASCARR
jgi:predicted CoA-binding protein